MMMSELRVERTAAPLVERRKRDNGKSGTICARDRRNKTGVIGVCLVRTRLTSSGRACRFSAAHAGATNRKFNIDTLGREEAWRRALKFRADYERSLTKEAAWV